MYKIRAIFPLKFFTKNDDFFQVTNAKSYIIFPRLKNLAFHQKLHVQNIGELFFK